MMNKMMKKLAVLFTVAALAVTGTTVSVNAYDGFGNRSQAEIEQELSGYSTLWTCIVDTANIRRGPSENSDIIGCLNYGDIINVDGYTENGWIGLSYGGYVRGDLLTNGTVVPQIDEHVNPQYTWIEESNSWNSSRIQEERGWMSHDNNTFTVNVASHYLALRSWAETNPANEIAELPNGTMVQVQEFGSQFDYVYVPAFDMYGYVNNDYLAG